MKPILPLFAGAVTLSFAVLYAASDPGASRPVLLSGSNTRTAHAEALRVTSREVYLSANAPRSLSAFAPSETVYNEVPISNLEDSELGFTTADCFSGVPVFAADPLGACISGQDLFPAAPIETCYSDVALFPGSVLSLEACVTTNELFPAQRLSACVASPVLFSSSSLAVCESGVSLFPTPGSLIICDKLAALFPAETVATCGEPIVLFPAFTLESCFDSTPLIFRDNSGWITQ